MRPAIRDVEPGTPVPWHGLSRRQKMDVVLPLAHLGLSCAKIAAQIGVSRGSIITIRAALQKSGEVPPAAETKGGRPSKSGNKPVHRKPSPRLAVLPSGAPKINQYDFRARAEQRAASQGVVIRRENAFDPIPGTTPVPYGSHGCKWSVDGIHGPGMLWCGQSRDGDPSYCGAHRLLSISPRNERDA